MVKKIFLVVIIWVFILCCIVKKDEQQVQKPNAELTPAPFAQSIIVRFPEVNDARYFSNGKITLYSYNKEIGGRFLFAEPNETIANGLSFPIRYNKEEFQISLRYIDEKRKIQGADYYVPGGHNFLQTIFISAIHVGDKIVPQVCTNYGDQANKVGGCMMPLQFTGGPDAKSDVSFEQLQDFSIMDDSLPYPKFGDYLLLKCATTTQLLEATVTLTSSHGKISSRTFRDSLRFGTGRLPFMPWVLIEYPSDRGPYHFEVTTKSGGHYAADIPKDYYEMHLTYHSDGGYSLSSSEDKKTFFVVLK